MYQQDQLRTQTGAVVDEGLRKFMLSIYNLMFLGMAATGIVAMLIASNEPLLRSLIPYQMPIAFLPFGMAIGYSFLQARMSKGFATAYFFAFAIAMGVSTSFYFYIYTSESIARAFFSSAVLFGAMSLYGYTTKKDLTGWGKPMMIAFLVVIVTSLVNAFFLKSTGLELLVSAFVVFLSAGITAWETQLFKNMYYQITDAAQRSKFVIMAALNLYINFINMFLSMLRLMGEQR